MSDARKTRWLWAMGVVVYTTLASAQANTPVIEQIQPTSGPPGTLVNIVGRRFTSEAKVNLGHRSLPVEASLPNRLSVRIPEGAPSGNIAVSVAGFNVRGPEFRVTPPPPAPVIDEIEPHRGPPGSHVVVRGKHFSALLTGNVVTLGGRPVVVRSATPDQLEVIIPEETRGGPFVVRVDQAGEAASKVGFEVSAATSVSELSPPRGAPGVEVKIRGRGFSRVAKQNRVYLNNVPVPVKTASETELVVQLPPRIASGKLLVDVQGAGRAFSSEAFVVQHPPTIIELTPERATPGTSIAVRGTNFGTSADEIEATLGDAKLGVSEVRDTSLRVLVPEGALTDRLSIRVRGIGPAWSKQALVVVPVLKLDAFTPTAGPAGSELIVTGQGFGDTVAKNKVSIGGQAARVLEASPTKLKLRVPKTKSGPVLVAVAGGGEIRSVAPFVITVPPQVNSIAPDHGPAGTLISIRGSGFGENAAVVKVTLAGKPLEVRSVRDDELSVSVPSGSKSGRVRVEIPLQGAAEPAIDFTLSK